MKNKISIIIVIVIFWSCDTKEKALLKYEVDSLRFELVNSRNNEEKLNEVGVLLDSIDAARKLLKLEVAEGKSAAGYIARLQDINAYIKLTESKILALDAENKNSSKQLTASIRRLKTELAANSEQIIDLQNQLSLARSENKDLWVSLSKRDSILSFREEVIKVSEADIASLEKMINDTKLENKVQVASLYYAQAFALETAADRTHFAPKKRKATRLEALELYRLALALGNTDAEPRISHLQKKLG